MLVSIRGAGCVLLIRSLSANACRYYSEAQDPPPKPDSAIQIPQHTSTINQSQEGKEYLGDIGKAGIRGHVREQYPLSP